MRLPEYLSAIEEFSVNLRGVGHGLSRWVGIDHIARGRLLHTGNDIIQFADTFVPAQIAASNDEMATTAKIKQHLQAGQLMEIPSIQRSPQIMNILMTSYKAYFFFLRAFQDGAYVVLLNILTGQKGREESSMSDALQDKSSVHTIIASIDGYIDWFKDFKDMRDTIKRGVAFSSSGSGEDVGVVFNRHTPDNGIVVNCDSSLKHHVRVKDLTEAIRFSNLLLKEIENCLRTAP